MRQKKWKERIGENSGLIIIGAFIVLSIILILVHLLQPPYLLLKTPSSHFEWNELILDLFAIFIIGLISFTLVRKSEAERSEIEQIRWRERDKAQEYLDVTGVILLALNAEQKVTLINRKGCKILGYKEEGIIGKNWFDHFLPEWDRERVKATFVRLMSGGHKAAEYFENPVLTKSGEERIIAWHNTLLADERGNITGTLSSGEDITERKKAEEALKDSEERFRQLAENIDQVFWLTDWDAKRLLYVNPAYERLYGRSCQSAYDNRMSWQDIIHSEDRARVKKAFARSADLGQYVEAEYRVVRDDGTERWVLDRSYPIRDKYGRIYRFASVAEDITKRKKAEEALRESEEKYRALIEAAGRAGEGIIIIQDNKEGEAVFISVNDQFCKMSGYSEEELLGRSPWDLIPYEISVRLKDWYKRRHNGESLPGHYEAAGVRKDGTVVPLDLSIVTMPWQGKIATVLYIRDITERKKAEEALRESQAKLQSIFSAAPAGIGMTIDQTIRELNTQLCEITGYSKEELSGKSISVVYPSDQDYLSARSKIYNQLREKGHSTIEASWKRKDGKLISVLLNCALLKPDDFSQGITFTVLDITERKKAEQAIRTEKDKLENVTRNIGVGLAIVSKDYRTLWANDVLKQIFGEVEGELCYSTYNGRTDICPGCGVREVFEQGKDLSVHEQVGKDKDGRTIWSQIIATPLKDREGNINAAMEVVVPITERKRAEEELLWKTAFLESQVEANLDGVLVVDSNNQKILTNKRLIELWKVPQHIVEDKDDTALLQYVVSQTKYPEQFLEKVKYLYSHQDETSRDEIEFKNGMVFDRYSSPVVDKNGKYFGRIWTFRDITERKKAEEALRESQAKLQSIFSAAPAGIGMTTNQTIGELNTRLCEITGYSKEELSGKSISVVYPSDQDYLSARSEIYNQLREKGHSTIEASWKRKDGKLISVLLNSALLKPGDFSQGITFTVLDITERKRVEEALQASEKRFRDIADNAQEWIWEIDTEGKYTYASQMVEKLLGYTPEEILQKHFYDLFHPEDREALKAAAFAAFAAKQPFQEFINRNVHKNGQTIWLATSGLPLLDDKGNLLGYRGSDTDITERKRAEELLRNSEAQLSNAMKIAKLGYWEYDVAKDLFTFDNHFYAIFRTTAEKVGGYTMSSARYAELFVHPDDLSVVGNEIRKALETTDPHYNCQLEHRVIYADGETGYITVRFFIVKDDKGHTIKTYGANQDITERKKAEEEIRIERDKLENVTRNIGVGLAIVSKDYRTLWANDVLKQIFGEVKGKLCYNTYNGRPDICPGCGVREVFEQGKNVSVHEQVGKDKDGNTIWSQIIATPLRDKEGNISAAMEVVVPITERKKAEERLKAEKEFSEKLISTTNAIIIGLDKEHRILLFNQGAERITGYKAEEIIGKDWFKIFFKEEMYPEMIRVWKDAWGKVSHGHTNLIYSKSGKEIVAQWSNTSIKDSAGEPIMLLCIAVDITKHKKAEEALRTSEEKYRAIVENATDQIFTLDRQCRFLAVNKTSAEISRKSVSEMVGKSLLQIFPKETAAQFSKNIEEVFETSQNKFIEERMCLGGKEFYSSTTLNPIKDDKGYVVAVTGIVRDITERKRLQEQLIQTEKLAAVGTLAYGIAHEFNNILAGMMANAELGLISKEREQIKECFEIIVDNSHRASSITNNLLAFARHKEGRKELVDITEPLKSVLAITHRELEKHNIEVIEKFKPVPKIYCDPGQFSEVFLNMITNARDAMHPKGGTLTIQVEPAEDDIRIIFKDTGCGIPEEIKGRIFEPFITTKGALGKSEIPGTGLGLFLTYGIINGYKGKIEVETKVGKGTKFSIIIPISENQPPELLLDTRIESSKKTEKKLKILLVDDEKAITLGLKKFLESKGHKVSTSLRAKEGLEIFRKGRFDLVLSDLTIPDMDGIELVKKVKEKDPQAKIIVITGHLQKEKEEKARQAGADEVLIKPFKNELLYQTISKIVI